MSGKERRKQVCISMFYCHTAFKLYCLVYCFFTCGVWLGRQVSSRKSLSGLYLKNCEVEVVHSWWGHLLGGVGV